MHESGIVADSHPRKAATYLAYLAMSAFSRMSEFTDGMLDLNESERSRMNLSAQINACEWTVEDRIFPKNDVDRSGGFLPMRRRWPPGVQGSESGWAAWGEGVNSGGTGP